MFSTSKTVLNSYDWYGIYDELSLLPFIWRSLFWPSRCRPKIVRSLFVSIQYSNMEYLSFLQGSAGHHYGRMRTPLHSYFILNTLWRACQLSHREEIYREETRGKLCSVAKSGILSRDLGIFWSSWDFLGIFIWKSQSRDFLGIFQKGKFDCLEMDFFVKLPRNKQFC
jgi:hypothetical protein